jgi:hypothetical protein
MPDATAAERQPVEVRVFETEAALLATSDSVDGEIGYAEDTDAHYFYRGGAWSEGTTDNIGSVSVALTAAEIKALAASPKTLVAAQGTNKVLVLVSAVFQLHDDGTDYDDAAGDGDLVIKYVDDSGVAASAALQGDGLLDAATEGIGVFVPTGAIGVIAQLENTALVLDNDGAEYTTGTRTATVHVTYRVVDVS